VYKLLETWGSWTRQFSFANMYRSIGMNCNDSITSFHWFVEKLQFQDNSCEGWIKKMLNVNYYNRIGSICTSGRSQSLGYIVLLGSDLTSGKTYNVAKPEKNYYYPTTISTTKDFMLLLLTTKWNGFRHMLQRHVDYLAHHCGLWCSFLRTLTIPHMYCKICGPNVIQSNGIVENGFFTIVDLIVWKC